MKPSNNLQNNQHSSVVTRDMENREPHLIGIVLYYYPHLTSPLLWNLLHKMIDGREERQFRQRQVTSVSTISRLVGTATEHT